MFGQRLQHCAEKDHPHCYEEAKISGQPELFMLSALQILFLTSRKHLIATLPIFTRSLALPLALDRVSPGKFASGLKSIHSHSNGGSQANSTILDADGKRNDGRRSTFTNRGSGRGLPKRTDSVCPWHQALLTTNIQALVLRIRKECSCCKMAAGDTTVGSPPSTLAIRLV